MKYFLFLTLITSQAFAMDFNKVTGSFDVSPEKSIADEAETTVAVGTFGDQQQTRTPASENSEVKKTHVTEITGSFK